MSTALPTSTIYDDILPEWYVIKQPIPGGEEWYSAQLYFQGPTGDYGFYSSVGPLIYTVDKLRWDAARYMSNSQCTGGITNERPKSFQPMPIYFK
jgi:hypothetical protein